MIFIWILRNLKIWLNSHTSNNSCTSFFHSFNFSGISSQNWCTNWHISKKQLWPTMGFLDATNSSMILRKFMLAAKALIKNNNKISKLIKIFDVQIIIQNIHQQHHPLFFFLFANLSFVRTRCSLVCSLLMQGRWTYSN